LIRENGVSHDFNEMDHFNAGLQRQYGDLRKQAIVGFEPLKSDDRRVMVKFNSPTNFKLIIQKQ